MSSRRVLYIYGGKLRGRGLDEVVRQQVISLLDSGFDVDVIARGGFDEPRARFLGGKFTPGTLFSWAPSQFYNGVTHRWMAWRGLSLLKTNEYDAVIGWSRQSLSALKLANDWHIPFFLNVGNRHVDAPAHDDLRKGWPEFTSQEIIEEYQRADAIFVPSEYVKDSFVEQGIDETKLQVILRGIDTEAFTPDPELSMTPVRFLFCGRLSERKGIWELLEVWQQAWKDAKLPKAELWLVGGVPNENQQRLQEYLQSGLKNSVKVLGQRKDVPDLMRQCHVQVLLSRHEGMAKSLVEGALSGLFTIATKDTGFPFEIASNASRKVDRTAHESLVKLFQEVAENLAPLRAKALKQRASFTEAFSHQAFRARFSDKFQELLSERQDNTD